MESLKKKKLINTENKIGDCQKLGVGAGEMGEGNQKVQTSSYKVTVVYYIVW